MLDSDNVLFEKIVAMYCCASSHLYMLIVQAAKYDMALELLKRCLQYNKVCTFKLSTIFPQILLILNHFFHRGINALIFLYFLVDPTPKDIFNIKIIVVAPSYEQIIVNNFE